MTLKIKPHAIEQEFGEFTFPGVIINGELIFPEAQTIKTLTGNLKIDPGFYGKPIMTFNAEPHRVEFGRFLPSGTWSDPQSSTILTTRKGYGVMADGVGPKMAFRVEDDSLVEHWCGGVSYSQDFTNDRSALLFQIKSGPGDVYGTTEALRADFQHTRIRTPLLIKEVTTGTFDTAGYGQVWVKDDTPNVLMFRDDAGNDIQLGAGGGYTEGARVTDASSQTIPNGSTTMINFDTERYDTDDIHSNTVNNTRLTCKTAGKYAIVASIRLAANATGIRACSIIEGGANYIASSLFFGPTAGDSPAFAVNTIWDLAVNDYVEVGVYQNSGGNLDVRRSLSYSPEFMMQRIG